MSQTVVGVFDSYQSAENAQQELISSGFESSDVHIRMHAAHAVAAGTESVGSSLVDSLRELLGNLFGGNHEDIGHYSEAVRRGHVVVAITVADDALVTVAQSALRGAGALDIEKQVETWREQGYNSFDPASAPYTEEEVRANRARVQPALEDNPDIAQQTETYPSRAYPFQMAQTPYDDIMGKSGGVNTGG
ncbi:hypothetical protein [Glaciimonas sp. PAMC28666]|uniref:hypothetical protein n=1 Tax=Glaciimonas sp. PAMC28666 TaxID=2807626 RepID=UPI001966A414|nr:hypothetical protein [Glaciimonas sp. PAMC28666]QRX82359.1 hypothetical protein JQN73_20090 [Glaciimonas sp. PAMC28666]